MRLFQIALCTFILALSGMAMAFTPPEMHAPTSKCDTCHESAAPTADDAALKACGRHDMNTAPQHETSEAPDVFVMDELSEIYVPVVFPHKLHAAMTEMTGGCSICHHNQEDGEIHRCKACHGGPSNPNNLRQPGLKGAYHRQCLGCHREWTHETDCVVCHAKIDPDKPFEPDTTPADIMGGWHPQIEVPDTRVFEVEELEDTPLVTFHHKDHTEVFGLSCVQCHQQESCFRCHDLGEAKHHVRADPHEDCILCHQTEVDEDCMYCHDTKERPTFDHLASTGHDVTSFHPVFGCRDCHGGERRLEPLEDGCGDCHEPDWSAEDFDHARTGTPLDELHVMLECVDCHLEGMGSPARCDDCHDDGRKTFSDVATDEGTEDEAADDTEESEEADGEDE